jgi:crossover junction endodeoxyribonuclease RuvC
MVVLGIDPGYATLGYGAVSFDGDKRVHVAHGVITTTPRDSFCTRLELIFDGVSEILENFRPNELAIEKLYFQSNHKTAIDVAQARGVVLLAIKKRKIPVFEYTPLQVKMSVTGYGKAMKCQVMEMVKKLLLLEKLPKPDDAADALALAVCHASFAQKSASRFLMRRGY